MIKHIVLICTIFTLQCMAQQVMVMPVDDQLQYLQEEEQQAPLQLLLLTSIDQLGAVDILQNLGGGHSSSSKSRSKTPPVKREHARRDVRNSTSHKASASVKRSNSGVSAKASAKGSATHNGSHGTSTAKAGGSAGASVKRSNSGNHLAAKTNVKANVGVSHKVQNDHGKAKVAAQGTAGASAQGKAGTSGLSGSAKAEADAHVKASVATPLPGGGQAKLHAKGGAGAEAHAKGSYGPNGASGSAGASAGPYVEAGAKVRGKNPKNYVDAGVRAGNIGAGVKGGIEKSESGKHWDVKAGGNLTAGAGGYVEGSAQVRRPKFLQKRDPPPDDGTATILMDLQAYQDYQNQIYLQQLQQQFQSGQQMGLYMG